MLGRADDRQSRPWPDMARRVGPGWEVAHFGSCYKKAYNSYITSVRALRFVRSRGLRRGGVAAVCRARIIPGRTRPLAPATASDLPACSPPPLAHRPGPLSLPLPCSQESMPLVRYIGLFLSGEKWLPLLGGRQDAGGHWRRCFIGSRPGSTACSLCEQSHW